MKKTALTKRQKQVLCEIEKFISENGYPPTRVDIANIMDFGPNAANQHIKAIEKKGAIKITPKTSRGLTVLVKSCDIEVSD